MSSKRRIFAAWLLSVVLPTVFLAPFHHHDLRQQENYLCEDCSQHLPHHGHLSVGTAAGECLVCQLLFHQYVPAENTIIQSFVTEPEAYSLPIPKDVVFLSFQPSSPRAPPVSFCR